MEILSKDKDGERKQIKTAEIKMCFHEIRVNSKHCYGNETRTYLT